MPPRVYDCFTFFNEINLLEMRLREMYDAVDRFVLVEARQTFSGAAKPLYFLENRARLQPFLDKVTHVVLDEMPATDNPWVREAFQRNSIMRGLGDAGPEDLIIISDVDEILRPAAIASLRNSDAVVAGFRMPLFYCKLNYVNVSGTPNIVWPVAVRNWLLRLGSAQQVRDFRHGLARFPSAEQPAHATVYANAGWHFSYIGDDEFIRRKIRSFSHQEFNTPEVLGGLDVERMLAAGEDLFGRKGFVWRSVMLDDYFPRTVLEDRGRWAPHIVADAVGCIRWDRQWLDTPAVS
jgi:hypothetical protein